MLSRRETAWKKSRTFGDVKGGRAHPKITDKIFARAHSIPRLPRHTELPVFVRDNPSRDYFFPITESDVRRELAHLPKRDWAGVTHIWFRRFRASDYEAGEIPLAEFCCGSGVRVVVLYPWPKSLRWNHGPKKPAEKLLKILEHYEARLTFSEGEWVSEWKEHMLKNMYVEYLLFHEIGHHVDRYTRRWSKANRRQIEEVADQYAFARTTKRSIVYRAKLDEAVQELG